MDFTHIPHKLPPGVRLALRERKFAATRLGLLQALVEELDQRPMDEIGVRDLCDLAQISEATFFNYFPRKSDLVAYASQLWGLELGWLARQAGRDLQGLAVIERLFDHAALHIQRYPGLMGEIIAFLARSRERQSRFEIGNAERYLAFPDCPGIEDLPEQGLDAVLMHNLEQAIAHGQLPHNTHLPGALIALITAFYGVPLVLRASNPKGIGSMYRQQLQLLWAGLKGVAVSN